MTHDELMAKIDNDLGISKVLRAFDALRAVVELHRPKQGENILECTTCIDGEYYDNTYSYEPYPCTTISTIERLLND